VSRRFRLRSLASAAALGAVALALAIAGTAHGNDHVRKVIPGGWITLRERSPLSPVLIVRKASRTTFVKLTPAKSPGICDVVHWDVAWPFVTVVAQPGEDHGGRADCQTDLDRSVIWLIDFSRSVARPAIYSAGLDYPLGP
jgi:hypothetical protein